MQALSAFFSKFTSSFACWNHISSFWPFGKLIFSIVSQHSRWALYPPILQVQAVGASTQYQVQTDVPVCGRRIELCLQKKKLEYLLLFLFQKVKSLTQRCQRLGNGIHGSGTDICWETCILWHPNRKRTTGSEKKPPRHAGIVRRHPVLQAWCSEK